MRFAELLAPISLREFVDTYVHRRVLHVPGDPDKIAGLFDRARLLAIVAAHGDAAQPALVAGFRTPSGDHRRMSIAPAQLDTALAAGMTVMIDHLELADADLRALVEDTRRTLAIPEPTDIGAFLSPADSGFGIHFDQVDNWVIQIEGRKRWRYSEEPAVHLAPLDFVPNARERAEHIHGLDEAALATVDLAPGDVLYLPPGTWHQPVALDEVSLHLSLIVRPVSRFTLFEPLVAARLAAAWRRLPWGAAHASPSSIEDELARDRDALVAALQAIDPRALHDAWRVKLPAAEPAAIDEGTRLRRVREVRHAVEGAGDDTVLLLLDGDHIVARLPSTARPVLERLAAVAALVAVAATAWDDYAWDEVQAVLTVLVSLGVLTVAG